MRREEIIKTINDQKRTEISRLYDLRGDDMKLVPGYEGCENLVYKCEREDQPVYLRISFRPERTGELIQAELHFIHYLAKGGVRVSQPEPSINGRLLETINHHGIPLHIVAFTGGKGMRVPDNGYRYREEAPIEEYYQNWGQVLGQMHNLTKSYQSISLNGRRPDWFELHQEKLEIDKLVPARLPVVREKITALLEEIRSLPKDRDGYGLIHGDFNDGNFTVDYTNGDMTVFDFDDCCYFWFAYELASAWEAGIGRIMFRPIEERVAFMSDYMEQVMQGYQRENTPPFEWGIQLPLFVRLIQVEEFLYFVRYFENADQEMQSRLNYKIRCIEEEIPYMGFFDRVYSPERPFSL